MSKTINRVRGRRKTVGLVLLPVSIVGASAIIAASSYAVFTSSTSSPSNSWSTGSVILKNDSSGTQAATGSALFNSGNSGNLGPGGSGIERCVTVESSGTLPSAIKLYGTAFSQTNSLATYLDLQVEIGTATSTAAGSCATFTPTSTIFPTGTLDSFRTAKTNYSSGISTWSPTGATTETRAFKFTVTPKSSMTNTQQTSNATLEFVWEANNT